MPPLNKRKSQINQTMTLIKALFKCIRHTKETNLSKQENERAFSVVLKIKFQDYLKKVALAQRLACVTFVKQKRSRESLDLLHKTAYYLFDYFNLYTAV